MCPTPFFSANSKWDEFFSNSVNCLSWLQELRFLLEVTSYSVGRSLSGLLHLLWSSPPSCCAWTWHCFILPYGWLIYHCVYKTHFLYSFLCPCTLRLHQCLWNTCYGNWSSRDSMGNLASKNVAFPWLYAQACDCCFLRHFYVLFFKDSPYCSFSWMNSWTFLVILSKLISWWEFLFLNFSHFYFANLHYWLFLVFIAIHSLFFSTDVQLINIVIFALRYNIVIQCFNVICAI